MCWAGHRLLPRLIVVSASLLSAPSMALKGPSPSHQPPPRLTQALASLLVMKEKEKRLRVPSLGDG